MKKIHIIQIVSEKYGIVGLDKKGNIYDWREVPIKSSAYQEESSLYDIETNKPIIETRYSKYKYGWVLRKDTLNK